MPGCCTSRDQGNDHGILNEILTVFQPQQIPHSIDEFPMFRIHAETPR